jgi:hypothetical protein
MEIAMNTIPASETINQYLDLMDAQREAVIKELDGLTEAQLWQRPAPGEWSIGEILNHTVLLIRSMFPFVRLAWRWFRWTSTLFKNRPYRTQIEDPYRKQNFPHWFSFPWKPKYTPENPVPLSQLLDEMRQVHDDVRAFYQGKHEAMLGHVYLFDPLFGFINLILILQIGLYHDQLHYDDVFKQINVLRG